MDSREPWPPSSVFNSSQDEPLQAPAYCNWTLDEHTRFVDALEQLHSVNQSNQDAWDSITAAVQTRSLAQVKLHATEYLFRLQTLDDCPLEFQATVSAVAEPDVVTGTRWTKEENAQLEDLLADYSLPTTSATYYPWALIAQRIPNKTQQDVQEQYEQLCRDIESIDQREPWPTRQISQGPSMQLRMELHPSPTSIFSQCFPSPITPLSPFPSESAFELPWVAQQQSRGQRDMPQPRQTAGFSTRNVLLISALPTPKESSRTPEDNASAF